MLKYEQLEKTLRKERYKMNINDFMKKENEKPLDNLVSDGGFLSGFRTIGCIGDSLSSGEFQSLDKDGNNTYHDLFEYSWGQYIARIAGTKVYNFSRGGMTASEYCKSFARNSGFFGADKACQAYIIALGKNDLGCLKQELGTIEDVLFDTEGKETFARYYGEIIKRYKEISPDARFFLMTLPDDDGVDYAEAHRDLIYKMAEIFEHTYVIDLYKYAPKYDDKFKEQFFLSGHMNAFGYILTAKMVISYIDYIIRHNMDDFRKISLINTGIEYGI